MKKPKQKKIVILGAGFGGIRCALDLVDKLPKNTKLVLISDTEFFEFHAALYKIISNKPPMEVIVPLYEIFKGKHKQIEIIEDRIVNIDHKNKILYGSSRSKHSYDILVAGVGSQTSYFNIPGLRELSFEFKNIYQALKLRRHVREVFSSCRIADDKEKVCATHFVVVGGGISGVEIAGELSTFARELASEYQLDPSLVTIDLIHSRGKLVNNMPTDVADKIEARLRKLGVNIFLNRRILEEEVETVHLKDMELKAKTVIWAAGIVCNELYKTIPDIKISKRGKVEVNGFLQATAENGNVMEDLYVLGDGAEEPNSGMAFTAVYHGRYIAKHILARLAGTASNIAPYKPREVAYFVPIGPNWTALWFKNIKIYGIFADFIYHIKDFLVFWSILPFRRALMVFKQHKTECAVCWDETKEVK